MRSIVPGRPLQLPRQLPWGRALAWAVATGAAVAGLAQAVPPLHVPTHEFTQLFVVLAGVVQLHLSAAVWRWTSEREGRDIQALCVALTAAVVMGGAAYVVQAAANLLVHRCDGTGTTVFFWVTWIPLGAWASVLGVVCAAGGYGWIKRSLVILALGLLSLIHAATQVFAGVRVVDPWIGDNLFTDQRAEMILPRIHLLGRLWLVGLTATFWFCWSAWRRRDETLTLRAVLATAVLVLVSVTAGSHLGIGPGRGLLKSELDGEYRTEHFRFLYDTNGDASLRLDDIAREAEYAHHRLSEAWARQLGEVEVRLYDSYSRMRRVKRVDNAHAVPYCIDMPWWRALGTTMAHELVHALHAELSWNPRLVLSRGMLEGSAEAFSEGYAEFPATHYEQAGALRANHLPAARDFMSLTGFWKVNESNAYSAAGSFVGFLVLRHGADRWVEMQRRLDYEAVYDMDLDALDRAWREFLAQVPLKLEDQAAARERFDPVNAPGVFDDTCPKLGTTVRAPEEEARDRSNAGDRQGALELYRDLYEEDADPRWAWGMVSALQWSDHHDEALQVLEQTLGRPEEPDQQLRWLKVRMNSLLHLGRWEAIDATLEQRAELEQAGEPPLVQALLRDPAIREELAEILVRGSSRNRRLLVGHQLRQLAEEHPEHADALHRLMLTRGFIFRSSRYGKSVSIFAVRDIEEALEFIEEAPRSCDELAQSLYDATPRLLDAGRCDLAERVVATIATRCETGINTARAEMLSERLRWEHEVHGELDGACVSPSARPREG